MMRNAFFALTITFILAAVKTMACSCAPQLDFKSKDDLKQYDFVALVQVTKLSPLVRRGYMPIRASDMINIRINELFKGDTTSVIHDYMYQSDCAFDMKVGEQWLLFATTGKGGTSISKCGYSRFYSDSTGKRDWIYFSGVERLNMLRQLYGHSITPNLSNKIYYPNGKVEIEQSFKKGLLNGIRKIYYPTGELYVAEKFKDGKRVEFRNIYLPSGQLIFQTLYKNGLKTQITGYQDTAESAWYINYQIHHNKDLLFGDNSCTPAQYTAMLDSLRKIKHWDKQISMSRKFLPDGRSFKLEMYDYRGDTSAIGYLDWDKRINEHTVYRKGKLQYTTMLDQFNDTEIEHDYDRKPGQKRDFIKKCESCKYYFDETKPPEATPEAVYY